MMTVYRISTCHYIDDLSGEGAFLHGARWNSPGTRVLYTAENAALAMLEALAHITMLQVKQPFCLVRLTIPNEIASIDVASLPPNWKQQPPPDTLRKYGDVFVANGEALALKVPSVLVPDNFNFLINPHHVLFSKIKKIAVSNISFDQRLFSSKS